MALTDSENSGFVMPVAPAYGGGYGNGGFGFGNGDWAWIILLLLIGGNGWGFGGGFGGGMMWPMMMGGMNGFGLDYLYPWLNNSQHISDGFRDQFLNTQIGDLRTDVNRGFGDVQLGIAGINQNLCQTGNAITGAVRDGFSAAEIAANGRQMASMQQVYGIQSQLAQCCCDNRAATQDLKYTLATEACATRAANGDNTQKILDKLCQLELDGVKQNAETRYAALEARYNQALAENQALRFDRSQTAQNAFISQGFTNEVDALYNRLSSCPVPTTPVYGRTPIFTCPGSNVNPGCGCGGNTFGFTA